ncbi:ABC1 kinase family protein [Rubellimicrobium aerolatum]|uniref:ABC1 kinase family protein n=1 Tax=Rubellimicrobium aerolatum TaxID=490979 RepID=A0ABW0SGC6_9RHOB|nr:AarF/ABC1/UbiB kinase family protein [Rubellimicrobium aerolatum]MBP1807397.1 putative unusual protein kinase regulating ubiquinone biosynthesis (AarF/ABC1/UbiB family) [Rubellimicrobium aerolatum]
MSRDPRPKGTPIPSGRLARLTRLGGLAAGVAGGTLAEGARALARGERPGMGDLLLTPANARRVADRLAEMRGAAMKMGQLLSMDAGDLLPPELSDILARLRAGADPMPPRQLGQVLDREWGPGWRGRFVDFDTRPLAAASIGQVHRARLRADHDEGRDLAIKVQYPGVARSIDSDVDNVAALLRLSRLAPEGLDLAPLLAEAKRQLREEADYAAEAGHLRRFGALLADDPRFRVPEVAADLSTPRVLAMTYEPGEPLESLARAPQATRDRVAAAILDLGLAELFRLGWMQTDPNLANYRWDGDRVVLLDFGATRSVPPDLARLYRRMLLAARDRDRTAAEAALRAFGALDDRTPPAHRAEALALFDLAAGAMLHDGPFDFGRSDLLQVLRDRGTALAQDRSAWRVPPAEAIFVQRKLGGLYLLAARLGARLDLRALVAPYLAEPDLA